MSRSVVGRAVAVARGGPAGPVHLNVGFREPLVPSAALGPIEAIDEAAGDLRASTPRPFTDVVGGRAELSASDVAGLADRLASVARGLILAGPQDDPGLPAALARLAAATGYPILADPLSLRSLRTARPVDRASATATTSSAPGHGATRTCPSS